MCEPFAGNSLDKLKSLTKKPEKFLSAPDKLVEDIKGLIKQTYDFTKNEEPSKTSDSLPELIVNNFDLEQIWQQIELQNNKLFTESLTSVSRLVAAKERLWFVKANEEESENSEAENDNENSSEEKEDDGKDDTNQSIDEEDSDVDENDNLELEEDLSDEETDKPINKLNKKNVTKPSIVDDEFFKLDEMEQFLQNEERNIDKKQNDDENDSDEESVDLFDANPDDIEDESADEEDESQINPKYDDFFGEANKQEKPKKRLLPPYDSDKDSDEEAQPDISKIKSSLELREERLKKKIEDIEERAIQEKPWQLKGEITADNRPQNSLLEEVVEFDLTTRPAPVITEETTLRLEDVIRQRIKDKVWDDVERKTKVVETPAEYKKKLMLDQEKSKQSLAQIYENEFIKQKEALDPDAADKPEEEPKEHIEIKSLMKDLFSKLDALSNFHFTPKSVAPELRIVNNMPAINMEEVAPVAASDAALLAPEEIKGKPKGDIIGRGERTDTDKNRERRQKKQKQREHAREKEKKEKIIEKMRPGLGNKYSKQKAAKLLDKITKDRNVDKMDESIGASGVKSSTAFFTQLQEEVKGHIKSKTGGQKKKNKEIHSAKKLKL